ncbi:MAG TPA: VCBS repeat-containing protein, partial [Thermoanaerobaculia bacterium]|nr:VCBS repeat-containing protein [Thermoanaerobaculia bacterium]
MVRRLLLLALVLGGAALHAEPRFMNAVPVVSGLADAPVFTTAADFTSDGIPDLLVASAKEIRVVPGRGHGAFGAPVVTPVAGLHVSGSADFDRDGRLDVYLSKPGEAIVAVLLANGDGTFGLPFVITTGAYDAVVAADFDGDHQIDVAAITGGHDAILHVFRSNGANGFAPLAPVPFGYVAVEDAAAGDFDGDGRIDIAVVGGTSNWILRNDGASFSPENWYTGESMDMIAAADFNGDGAADTVSAERDDSKATALVSFGKNGTRQSVPVRNVSGVHTADFDGDGLPDLVLVSAWAMTFAVVTSNADGTFDAPRLYLSGPRMGVTAAGDADGDGKVDLLAVNAGSSGGLVFPQDEPDVVSFIRGNGDGTMRAYRAFDIYLATNPTSSDALVRYAIMDVTGDGNFDVVVYDWRNERISVIASDGYGGFAPVVHTPTLEEFQSTTFLPAGDLDGDGHDDILLAKEDSWAVLH